MRAWLLILLIPLSTAAQPLPAHMDEALVRDSLWGDGSLFQFDQHDEAAGDIRLLLDSGRAAVEWFFGAPFSDPLPSRSCRGGGHFPACCASAG